MITKTDFANISLILTRIRDRGKHQWTPSLQDSMMDMVSIVETLAAIVEAHIVPSDDFETSLEAELVRTQTEPKLVDGIFAHYA